MHDGSLARFEDVIEHYNRGGNANPPLDSEHHALHLSSDEAELGSVLAVAFHSIRLLTATTRMLELLCRTYSVQIGSDSESIHLPDHLSFLTLP